MRQKVLVLTPFYPPNIGGVETFCKNLVRELKIKYLVDVCTIGWHGQKTFGGVGIMQFFDVFPRLFVNFALRIARDDISIVHAQGFNAALIGKLLKWLYGYNLYVTTHAFYDFRNKGFLFRRFARFILKGADKIFVEGESVRQDILTLGMPEEKIVMYCHWCDQEVFKPAERNNSELVVLCAGRLDLAEKGLSIMQEVQRQLQGEGVRFIYAKSIPHEDMPKYYQMADVVVIPSVYSESFPIVVIEAASCGCAVITSNRGSLPELVREWGYAVDPTVEEFASTILAFKDRGLLELKQQHAYEFSKQNFSSKNAEVFL